MPRKYRVKIRRRLCAGGAGVSSKLARRNDFCGIDPSHKYLMLSLSKYEWPFSVLALRQAQGEVLNYKGVGAFGYFRPAACSAARRPVIADFDNPPTYPTFAPPSRPPVAAPAAYNPSIIVSSGRSALASASMAMPPMV